MCNPVMFLAAGTTMKVAGQLREGKAQQQAANAQAAQSEHQALVEQDIALAEAQQIRRQGTRARAQAVVGAASSGVKIGEGSALDAEREVMQDAETDAYLAILSGDRSAANLRADAAMRRQAGRNARSASRMAAVSTLISAGAKGMSPGFLDGWDARGPNGTNDRSRFSFGSNTDWWARNGRSGD